MRTELIVDYPTELQKILRLAQLLVLAGYHAENSTLVAVSSDYSSIAWQILRHQLSLNGEVCGGISVDVPYPDQEWTVKTSEEIIKVFDSTILKENVILVEAGVIRGSNYQTLIQLLDSHIPGKKVVTSTMYENIGSKFKSDHVAEYYDDSVHDLTFWWEKFNNHWK